MTRLVFARNPDGRAFARPAPDDPSTDSEVLADWLTQDVPFADHARRLLAAGTTVTGNAYAMTPGSETVLLRHLHRSDRPAVRIARQRMAAELAAWAAFLHPDEDPAGPR